MHESRRRVRMRKNTQIIQEAILKIFDEMSSRLTVRQIFYALTVRGNIPKTENGYRKVQYQLKQMRMDGTIHFGWIADNTRWQIKPTSYYNLNTALNSWQEVYRRDLWSQQPIYCEIRVEKDALAGVISPITTEWDVPLMVSAGSHR